MISVLRATVQFAAKFKKVAKEEFAGLHPRLCLVRIILFPFPNYVGVRLRKRILRLAGFKIGTHTVFMDIPKLTGNAEIYRNLKIGSHCRFNEGCFFDLSAPVAIGNFVSFDQKVMVLTGSHAIGTTLSRASTLYFKSVTIGNGAWIGARVTILPGVLIGEGSIIAPGSVVHQNVAPNTLVAGIPARFVRQLT